MDDVYTQIQQTFSQMGIDTLTYTHCCQLLALVYETGTEEMAYDGVLLADIRQAMDTLDFKAIRKPSANTISEIERYVRQIKDYERDGVYKPEWISWFEDRYKTKFIRTEI